MTIDDDFVHTKYGTGYIIRELSVDDFAVWRRLWSNYQTFYKVALAEAVYVAAWERLIDDEVPIHGALAVIDDEVIGLVHWFYHPSLWRVQDVCYLQDLFVDPEKRSAGAGRVLIEYVYEHAQVRRAPEVYWHTHNTNETAMLLYDRIADLSGFVQYKKTFLPHPSL